VTSLSPSSFWTKIISENENDVELKINAHMFEKYFWVEIENIVLKINLYSRRDHHWRPATYLSMVSFDYWLWGSKRCTKNSKKSWVKNIACVGYIITMNERYTICRLRGTGVTWTLKYRLRYTIRRAPLRGVTFVKKPYHADREYERYSKYTKVQRTVWQKEAPLDADSVANWCGIAGRYR